MQAVFHNVLFCMVYNLKGQSQVINWFLKVLLHGTFTNQFLTLTKNSLMVSSPSNSLICLAPLVVLYVMYWHFLTPLFSFKSII